MVPSILRWVCLRAGRHLLGGSSKLRAKVFINKQARGPPPRLSTPHSLMNSWRAVLGVPKLGEGCFCWMAPSILLGWTPPLRWGVPSSSRTAVSRTIVGSSLNHDTKGLTPTRAGRHPGRSREP